MTTEHTPDGLIGRSVRRVEDPVLITGKGCYVDDIQLPGMLHMAFLRSPYPHANILSIQVSAARAMPGVVAVVTGDDLSERLHVPVMPLVPGMSISIRITSGLSASTSLTTLLQFLKVPITSNPSEPFSSMANPSLNWGLSSYNITLIIQGDFRVQN